MPIDSPPDWDSIELDYRTGALSDSDICQRHGITPSVLKNAADSRGWTQNMLTAEDEATVLGLSGQDSPRFPIDSLFGTDDIKKHALMTAGQMVRLHRQDIGKLRAISSAIVERLEKFTETGEHSQLAGFLGKNDSATDLLEKLSRITVRTVELERQAYGLDSMTIIPNEEEENQVTKDIQKLGERLHRITQQKAQKVEEKKDGINEESEILPQE